MVNDDNYIQTRLSSTSATSTNGVMQRWSIEYWMLRVGCFLALRVFQHFLDGCIALENAAQSVLAQRHHSELDRFLFENDGRRPLIDQFTDRISDFHQFVNAFAAFVTGVIARVASFAVEKLSITNVAAGELQFRE